jgi:hypothetical protein
MKLCWRKVIPMIKINIFSFSKHKKIIVMLTKYCQKYKCRRHSRILVQTCRWQSLFPYDQEKGWLFEHLLFYVPLLKEFFTYWRLLSPSLGENTRYVFTRTVVKSRPMLTAQGLWAGRDLYRATPALTRNLGFSGFIRRTAPFSRLLRHTRWFGRSILTWILKGPLSVAFYDTQE